MNMVSDPTNFFHASFFCANDSADVFIEAFTKFREY